MALVRVDGTIVEAEAALAEDRGSRGRLALAVKASSRARQGLRADPERGLVLWTALLAGLYSTVDRWEADGRKFLAVYRNDPRCTDPRALAPCERHVAELVALGASNKEAAYALGISPDAVQKTLAQALRKLGLSRRGELTSLFTGARDVLSLRVGEVDLEVLVASAEPSSELLDGLTEAERDVASAVMRGLANGAIASVRGTSSRTVANQIRSVFEKLGVASRGELRARLTVRAHPA